MLDHNVIEQKVDIALISEQYINNKQKRYSRRPRLSVPVTQLTKRRHLSFIFKGCLRDFTNTPHNVKPRLALY